MLKQANGRSSDGVSMPLPTNDLEKIGYAVMPNIGTEATFDRLGFMVAAMLSRFDYLPTSDFFIEDISGNDYPSIRLPKAEAGTIMSVPDFFRLRLGHELSQAIIKARLFGTHIPIPSLIDMPDHYLIFETARYVSDFLRDIGMHQVFTDSYKHDKQFEILFTRYGGFGEVEGINHHRAAHSDDPCDAVVLVFQFSADTLWRISRQLDDLPQDTNQGNLATTPHSLLAMDPGGWPPIPLFHNPLVGPAGRLSLNIICYGETRNAALTWMDSRAMLKGYETVQEITIDMRDFYGLDKRFRPLDDLPGSSIPQRCLTELGIR